MLIKSNIILFQIILYSDPLVFWIIHMKEPTLP